MKVTMSTALLAAAGVANAMSMTLDQDVSLFKDWQVKHGKVYESENHEMDRFRIFKENLAYINAHNLNKEEHGFTLGINHFADMTNDEYRKLHLASTPMVHNEDDSESMYHMTNMLEKPESMDWRDHGIVNEVKDQATCGSCWAFSTVASLEGQYALKNNKLVSLSEKQLVDCSGKFGNMGCNGGLMSNAFKYIQSTAHGLDLESEYPYHPRQGKCQYESIHHSLTPSATDKGFKNVRSGSEEDLLDAVATVGVISVAIDASHPSFQLYSHGVYNEKYCSSKRLDHGVAVVGYGSEDGVDYWIVRNSWGKSYGEKGYVRIARNKDNMCGIASMSSYPVI